MKDMLCELYAKCAISGIQDQIDMKRSQQAKFDSIAEKTEDQRVVEASRAKSEQIVFEVARLEGEKFNRITCRECPFS